jgi:glutamate N-acetyltransferase / amino-acid N-acetyltransferase
MTLTSAGSATFERLSDTSVTSASGFRAAAVAAGIKPSGTLDLGVLVSDAPCVVAGTFTQNAFPAAPVVLSRERLLRGGARAQAVVFNAGNANACTGQRGLADAEEMARLAGAGLGVAEDLVLVASTGVIGQFLPMDRVRAGLRQLQPRAEGGHEAARAIMTTDTRPKAAAVGFQNGVRIGAMSKGVGMIYPNMATMLAFIATDAVLETSFAQACLKRVVDRTFNMLTVDGDTSTNDACFLLANGLSGRVDATQFEAGLLDVCTQLARMMARDGEGATKLIEVDVTGAATEADARRVARAVVGSNLLKAAVHGEDPNWGRVFAAVGNSGAQVDPLRAALWIGSVQVARDGMATDVPRSDAQAQMTGEEVHFRVDLGLGSGAARAWGCDLTEAYVVENSAYTT